MAQVIRLVSDNARWSATIEGDRIAVDDAGTFVVREEGDGRFTVQENLRTSAAICAVAGESIWIGVDGHAIEFRVERVQDRVRPAGRDEDALRPPMSATVVRINVQPGSQVEAGDTLVVLEAMKMELPIRAPRAGVVRAVHCAEGQLVQPDILLVELD
jgi:biotin carboxyl carrier protein